MSLPGDVPVVLRLAEDTTKYLLQEWIRSEIPWHGHILDYRVDVAVASADMTDPILAVTVTLTNGHKIRRFVDLDDALREVAREMLQ